MGNFAYPSSLASPQTKVKSLAEVFSKDIFFALWLCGRLQIDMDFQNVNIKFDEIQEFE